MARATAGQDNISEVLAMHLEPHLTGGLSALFAAFRFMVQDHGLSIGPGEVKDVLVSLGFGSVTSSDALALFKALLGPKRQRKKALRLHDIARILGENESRVVEDINMNDKDMNRKRKEQGGPNEQQLQKP